MAPLNRPGKFRDQIDPIDAEHIEEMVASRGWAWVKHGIETMRDVKMRDLVRPHSEVETATLRGFIEACERALSMPAALMAEARKGKR